MHDSEQQVHISPDNSVLAAIKSPKLLTKEVLAGLVVALALIPEAIAFSLIAGVDPKLGLYSSFIMAMAIAFLGGRPAMITAATGAIALVIAPVARYYGIDYFIATVILAGIFQVAFGVFGFARLMRFIPRSVMIGFVNALTILIFMAQIPQLIDVPWAVYPLVALGILIMVLMPRITSVVPAPLIAILLTTGIAVTMGLNIPNVGDEGELPESLPEFLIPNVPLTLETFSMLAPFALAMALVGLLESLLTAKLVDDITDTRSQKTRESLGQGGANILSGLFGGMGGCAMIGQTMINVKVSGARTRISTFMAGLFLLILILSLGDFVAIIPMAALVAVMIMVSAATFNWHSVKPSTLKRMPKSETFVMVATVTVVVLTHNLAIGVIVGVIAAMVMFARRVAHFANLIRTVTDGDESPVAHYKVTGELFFASSNDLYSQFSYAVDPMKIVIDMSESHIWDASSIAALDSVINKYESHGKYVEIIGLNKASSIFQNRLSGHLGDGH